VGPDLLPHIREVQLGASGVHEEAPRSVQAGGKHRDIGDAIPIQAHMANLAEAIVSPIQPPLHGVKVQGLRLPNCIGVLDEIVVLLLRAPSLPGDDKIIIVSKVHLRRLH